MTEAADVDTPCGCATCFVSCSISSVSVPPSDGWRRLYSYKRGSLLTTSLTAKRADDGKRQ